jgi:hypothetical protein
MSSVDCCAHGESTAYDQSCQRGDIESLKSSTEAAYTQGAYLLALEPALPYHGDARSEFRFDGLRDPDTPVEQPSKSRSKPATSTSTGFFVF